LFLLFTNSRACSKLSRKMLMERFAWFLFQRHQVITVQVASFVAKRFLMRVFLHFACLPIQSIGQFAKGMAQSLAEAFLMIRQTLKAIRIYFSHWKVNAMEKMQSFWIRCTRVPLVRNFECDTRAPWVLMASLKVAGKIVERVLSAHLLLFTFLFQTKPTMCSCVMAATLSLRLERWGGTVVAKRVSLIQHCQASMNWKEKSWMVNVAVIFVWMHFMHLKMTPWSDTLMKKMVAIWFVNLMEKPLKMWRERWLWFHLQLREEPLLETQIIGVLCGCWLLFWKMSFVFRSPPPSMHLWFRVIL